MPKKKRQTFATRAVSLFLALCFPFTSLQAAPLISVADLPVSMLNVEIPPSAGTVSGSFVPKTGERPFAGLTIAHIQDIHAHPEAQRNIRDILRYLHETQGFDLIFLEGGLGQLDPTRLNFFEEPEHNAELVEMLVDQGVIDGAEEFLFESYQKHAEKNIRAYGVETADFYKANLEQYRQVYKHSSEVEQWAEAFEKNIMTDFSKVAGKELYDFFREWVFYEQHRSEILRFLNTLRKLSAQTLQIDLSEASSQIEWPMLSRLEKIREIEGEMDKKAVDSQKEELVRWLQNTITESPLIEPLKTWQYGQPIKSGAFKSTREYLERFYDEAAPRQFTFSGYPDLFRAMGFCVLNEEMDAKALFAEVESLKAEIFSALAQTEQEKNFIATYENFLLLHNLLKLELSYPQYEEVRGRTKELEKLLPGNEAREPALRVMQLAQTFYEGALLRDREIFKNTIDIIKKSKTDKAVLITGGFHSHGLQSFMRENNVAFVEISPRISDFFAAENYTKILTLKGNELAARSQVDIPEFSDPLVSTVLPEYADVYRGFVRLAIADILRRNPDARALKRDRGEALAVRSDLRTIEREDFMPLIGTSSMTVMDGVYPSALPYEEEAVRSNLDLSRIFARYAVADAISRRSAEFKARNLTRMLGIGSGSGLDAMTAIYQALIVEKFPAIDLELIEIHEDAVENMVTNITAQLSAIDAAFTVTETDGETVFDLGERGRIHLSRVSVGSEFDALLGQKKFDLVFFNAPNVISADYRADEGNLLDMREGDFKNLIRNIPALLEPAGEAVIETSTTGHRAALETVSGTPASITPGSPFDPMDTARVIFTVNSADKEPSSDLGNEKTAAEIAENFRRETTVLDVRTGASVRARIRDVAREQGETLITMWRNQGSPGGFLGLEVFEKGEWKLQGTLRWTQEKWQEAPSLYVMNIDTDAANQQKAGGERKYKYVGTRLMESAAMLAAELPETGGALHLKALYDNFDARAFYQSMKPGGLKAEERGDVTFWYLEGTNSGLFLKTVNETLTQKGLLSVSDLNQTWFEAIKEALIRWGVPLLLYFTPVFLPASFFITEVQAQRPAIKRTSRQFDIYIDMLKEPAGASEAQKLYAERGKASALNALGEMARSGQLNHNEELRLMTQLSGILRSSNDRLRRTFYSDEVGVHLKVLAERKKAGADLATDIQAQQAMDGIMGRVLTVMSAEMQKQGKAVGIFRSLLNSGDDFTIEIAAKALLSNGTEAPKELLDFYDGTFGKLYPDVRRADPKEEHRAKLAEALLAARKQQTARLDIPLKRIQQVTEYYSKKIEETTPKIKAAEKEREEAEVEISRQTAKAKVTTGLIDEIRENLRPQSPGEKEKGLYYQLAEAKRDLTIAENRKKATELEIKIEGAETEMNKLRAQLALISQDKSAAAEKERQARFRAASLRADVKAFTERVTRFEAIAGEMQIAIERDQKRSDLREGEEPLGEVSAAYRAAAEKFYERSELLQSYEVMPLPETIRWLAQNREALNDNSLSYLVQALYAGGTLPGDHSLEEWIRSAAAYDFYLTNSFIQRYRPRNLHNTLAWIKSNQGNLGGHSFSTVMSAFYVAGVLPEGASVADWQFSAGAMSFYDGNETLQGYTARSLGETLIWLAERRERLGGNSLSYLMQALFVAGRIQRGADQNEWQRAAGAYDFYQSNEVLQTYTARPLRETLDWLVENRPALNGRSLTYLIHALYLGSALPEGTVLNEWTRPAGAYDFYLSHDLLQQYEPVSQVETYQWLRENLEALGNRSLSYMVQAFSIAGRLPESPAAANWVFNAGAFERAINEREVIEQEIERIWSENVGEGLPGRQRLTANFNGALLLNLTNNQPLSPRYRRNILTMAWEAYGSDLANEIQSRSDLRETPSEISAGRFYDKNPVLQNYPVGTFRETLDWLVTNREALGGNSLAYLVQALAVSGRLPEGLDEQSWKRQAGAYDFYLSSELLQGHEVEEMRETLRWLSENREALGGNSLGYLVQSLAVSGRLPEGASEQVWVFNAGAYDFYLSSELLQSHEAGDMRETLRWLSENREALGGNSLAYLVQALAVSGRLPEGANEQSWTFHAGAYDFYLSSELLQGYEVEEMRETLRWLSENREALGGNSLSYLVRALGVSGRLPEGASEKNWMLNAAAYDFYLSSELLQSHEAGDMRETLRWLSENREALGGNSLVYLVLALTVSGRLPEGANEKNWMLNATAYDFYLSSELLQSHEAGDMRETLRWLSENREALGGNSLAYLVQALTVSGRLPEGANEQSWRFDAGAYDRALKEREVITNEIRRIWQGESGASYRTELARLKNEINPESLPNLKNGKPLSKKYRNMILGYAWDIYGSDLVEKIKNRSDLRETPSEISAGRFYDKNPVLQNYPVGTLRETLDWLVTNREALGGNSLVYLVLALGVSGRLPEGASEKNWMLNAAAYDFYLSSELLQSHEAEEIRETLRWLAENREELGGNSLVYLVQALAVSGRLPEGLDEQSWQRQAGAYDFYLSSELLQSHEAKEIRETLRWLAENREALGGNSLNYLVRALGVSGRLPEGANEESWERQAAAYDFYLSSELLQSHEAGDMRETLRWLAENREALGGNSLSYLVRALAVSGRLPEGANEQNWLFNAAAYDRALKEREVITNEIRRIWQGESGASYRTELARLKNEINPESLLNLNNNQPLSKKYRNMILGYAWDIYGSDLANEIQSRSDLREGRLDNGMIAVPLMDAGAEKENGKLVYRDSLRKLERLLPKLVEHWGLRDLYLYGGLFEIGDISRELHQVPHAGVHFLSSGLATIMVQNYDTKKQELEGVTFLDDKGNSFSIKSMLRLNPYLSDLKGRPGTPETTLQQFQSLTRRAREQKINVITDFIPWLAPGAISSANLDWTFNTEISPDQNARFRSLDENGKQKFIQDLLRQDNSQFVVRIGTGNDERLVRVRHLMGFGPNVDEVILNPMNPSVMRYYIRSLKQLIDLGVSGVRVDLAHTLLRRNLMTYFTDFGNNPGAAYEIPSDFEPWKEIVDAVRDYASQKGVDFEFIAEVYDPVDRGALQNLGFSTYYPNFFRDYREVANGTLQARHLEGSMMEAMMNRKQVLYPSNFDETPFASVGLSQESALMLSAVLPHLGRRQGLRSLVTWREALGMSGDIIPMVGGDIKDGKANLEGQSAHPFVSEAEEMAIRTDIDRLETYIGEAPAALVHKDFKLAATLGEPGDFEFLDNSDRSRFISLGWRAGNKNGDPWVILTADLQSGTDGELEFISVPKKVAAAFESGEWRARSLTDGQTFRIGQETYGDKTFTRLRSEDGETIKFGDKDKTYKLLVLERAARSDLRENIFDKITTAYGEVPFSDAAPAVTRDLAEVMLNYEKNLRAVREHLFPDEAVTAEKIEAAPVRETRMMLGFNGDNLAYAIGPSSSVASHRALWEHYGQEMDSRSARVILFHTGNRPMELIVASSTRQDYEARLKKTVSLFWNVFTALGEREDFPGRLTQSVNVAIEPEWLSDNLVSELFGEGPSARRVPLKRLHALFAGDAEQVDEAAKSIYDNHSELHAYEPMGQLETYDWLLRQQYLVNDYSLVRLVEALHAAGKLNTDISLNNWKRLAGSYEFYRKTPLLQDYRPTDMRETIWWMDEHREELGGNSPGYLLGAYVLLGLLPEGENDMEWVSSAAAYDFYKGSELLQSYKPEELMETLDWLVEHRGELGDNSLKYLIQAFDLGKALPADVVPEKWMHKAALYDFYVKSPVLQSYETQELRPTLDWLNARRAELNNNGLSYLVGILEVAGKLPEDAGIFAWSIAAGAYDRAIDKEPVIRAEIERIWKNDIGYGEHFTRLARLRARFDETKILNLLTGAVVSKDYRDDILGFAYDFYGRQLIAELEKGKEAGAILPPDQFPGDAIFRRTLEKHLGRAEAVAEDLGMSQAQTSRWIADRGYTDFVAELRKQRAPRTWTVKARYPGPEVMREMVINHEGRQKEIAAELGTSQVSAGKWIKRAGLENLYEKMKARRENPLKKKRSDLRDPSIEAVAKDFGFTDYQVSEYLSGGGSIRSQPIPVIQSQGQEFLIKRWHAGSQETMESLVTYVNALRESGVPVPMVAKASSAGNQTADYYTVFNRSDTGEEEYYTVEKRVAGRDVKRSEANPEQLKTVGRLLGAMHRAALERGLRIIPNENIYTLNKAFRILGDQREEWLPALAEIIPTPDFNVVSDTLSEVDRRFTRDALRKFPVLAIASDLNFANLKFNDDGTEITAVFDWDQARMSHAFEDLVAAAINVGRREEVLRYGFFVEKFPEDIESLIAGYEDGAGRKLTEDEKEMIPLHAKAMILMHTASAVLAMQGKELTPGDKREALLNRVNNLRTLNRFYPPVPPQTVRGAGNEKVRVVDEIRTLLMRNLSPRFSYSGTEMVYWLLEDMKPEYMVRFFEMRAAHYGLDLPGYRDRWSEVFASEEQGEDAFKFLNEEMPYLVKISDVTQSRQTVDYGTSDIVNEPAIAENMRALIEQKIKAGGKKQSPALFRFAAIGNGNEFRAVAALMDQVLDEVLTDEGFAEELKSRGLNTKTAIVDYLALKFGFYDLRGYKLRMMENIVSNLKEHYGWFPSESAFEFAQLLSPETVEHWKETPAVWIMSRNVFRQPMWNEMDAYMRVVVDALEPGGLLLTNFTEAYVINDLKGEDSLWWDENYHPKLNRLDQIVPQTPEVLKNDYNVSALRLRPVRSDLRKYGEIGASAEYLREVAETMDDEQEESRTAAANLRSLAETTEAFIRELDTAGGLVNAGIQSLAEAMLSESRRLIDVVGISSYENNGNALVRRNQMDKVNGSLFNIRRYMELVLSGGPEQQTVLRSDLRRVPEGLLFLPKQNELLKTVLPSVLSVLSMQPQSPLYFQNNYRQNLQRIQSLETAYEAVGTAKKFKRFIEETAALNFGRQTVFLTVEEWKMLYKKLEKTVRQNEMLAPFDPFTERFPELDFEAIQDLLKAKAAGERSGASEIWELSALPESARLQSLLDLPFEVAMLKLEDGRWLFVSGYKDEVTYDPILPLFEEGRVIADIHTHPRDLDEEGLVSPEYPSTKDIYFTSRFGHQSLVLSSLGVTRYGRMWKSPETGRQLFSLDGRDVDFMFLAWLRENKNIVTSISELGRRREDIPVSVYREFLDALGVETGTVSWNDGERLSGTFQELEQDYNPFNGLQSERVFESNRAGRFLDARYERLANTLMPVNWREINRELLSARERAAEAAQKAAPSVEDVANHFIWTQDPSRVREMIGFYNLSQPEAPLAVSDVSAPAPLRSDLRGFDDRGPDVFGLQTVQELYESFDPQIRAVVREKIRAKAAAHQTEFQEYPGSETDGFRFRVVRSAISWIAQRGQEGVYRPDLYFNEDDFDRGMSSREVLIETNNLLGKVIFDGRGQYTAQRTEHLLSQIAPPDGGPAAFEPAIRNTLPPLNEDEEVRLEELRALLDADVADYSEIEAEHALRPLGAEETDWYREALVHLLPAANNVSTEALIGMDAIQGDEEAQALSLVYLIQLVRYYYELRPSNAGEGDRETSRRIREYLELLLRTELWNNEAYRSPVFELGARIPRFNILPVLRSVLSFPISYNMSRQDYSPDGRYLATLNSTSRLSLWSFQSGSQLWENLNPGNINPPDRAGGGAHVMRFSPSGEMIVLGGGNEYLAVMDAENGEEIWTTGIPSETRDDEQRNRMIRNLRFSPDERFLGTVTNDEHIIVRDAGTGIILWDRGETQNNDPELGHTGTESYNRASVHYLKFSHDSSKLITFGADERVIAWDSATGQQLWRRGGAEDMDFLQALEDSPREALFTPDNSSVLVFSTSEIISYNLQTGAFQWLRRMPQERQIVVKGPRDIRGASLTADEMTAVFALATGEIVTWDLPAPDELNAGEDNLPPNYSPHRGTVAGLSFLIDNGNILMTLDARGTVAFWDTASGRHLWSQEDILAENTAASVLPREAKDIVFRQNGERLITRTSEEYNRDGDFRVWDTGARIRSDLREGNESVAAVLERIEKNNLIRGDRTLLLGEGSEALANGYRLLSFNSDDVNAELIQSRNFVKAVASLPIEKLEDNFERLFAVFRNGTVYLHITGLEFDNSAASNIVLWEQTQALIKKSAIDNGIEIEFRLPGNFPGNPSLPPDVLQISVQSSGASGSAPAPQLQPEREASKRQQTAVETITADYVDDPVLGRIDLGGYRSDLRRVSEVPEIVRLSEPSESTPSLLTDTGVGPLWFHSLRGGAMTQAARILMIGANAEEVASIFEYNNAAHVDVVNISVSELQAIQKMVPAISYLSPRAENVIGVGDRTSLYLADATRLSSYQLGETADALYFPDDTYHFVYVGIDSSAFLREEPEVRDRIMSRVAEEAMRVVKPGGMVLQIGDDEKYYANALREGEFTQATKNFEPISAFYKKPLTPETDRESLFQFAFGQDPFLTREALKALLFTPVDGIEYRDINTGLQDYLVRWREEKREALRAIPFPFTIRDVSPEVGEAPPVGPLTESVAPVTLALEVERPGKQPGYFEWTVARKDGQLKMGFEFGTRDPQGERHSAGGFESDFGPWRGFVSSQWNLNLAEFLTLMVHDEVPSLFRRSDLRAAYETLGTGTSFDAMKTVASDVTAKMVAETIRAKDPELFAAIVNLVAPAARKDEISPEDLMKQMTESLEAFRAMAAKNIIPAAASGVALLSANGALSREGLAPLFALYLSELGERDENGNFKSSVRVAGDDGTLKAQLFARDSILSETQKAGVREVLDFLPRHLDLEAAVDEVLRLENKRASPRQVVSQTTAEEAAAHAGALQKILSFVETGEDLEDSGLSLVEAAEALYARTLLIQDVVASVSIDAERLKTDEAYALDILGMVYRELVKRIPDANVTLGKDGRTIRLSLSAMSVQIAAWKAMAQSA